MTLLEAIRERHEEIVERLTAEFVRLGSEAEIREWIFEQDGPVELAAEMTGLELADEESAEVFALLDQLCRAAVIAAGGEEGWVQD